MNDILDDLRMVGFGSGDEARYEDARVAMAAYDEIVRLRDEVKRLEKQRAAASRDDVSDGMYQKGWR
jgi:hypothetical protein